MPADYHTHTPLCHHATGTPEEFIDHALARGLTEYGIADHAPATPEPFDDWRMLAADLPAYFDWIARARNRADGRIPVRTGFECDWLPGCESWIAHLASLSDWDYLIGSVHYLGEWDFDNPARIDLWNQQVVDEVWTRYWREYAAMAESGLFDLLGHADLVKKFGHRPAGDLRRFYEPAIEAISAAGCAIEINTAGWHKPCAEAYPEPLFLDLARSAGIPLAISSDAHAPQELARDFDRAIVLARNAGYTETVLFERRQRRFEPLPGSP
jgi:histidinol-phosphatase (PHP family)